MRAGQLTESPLEGSPHCSQTHSWTSCSRWRTSSEKDVRIQITSYFLSSPHTATCLFPFSAGTLFFRGTLLLQQALTQWPYQNLKWTTQGVIDTSASMAIEASCPDPMKIPFLFTSGNSLGSCSNTWTDHYFVFFFSPSFFATFQPV